MINLIKQTNTNRRFLVFTSASDQSCLRDWLAPIRNFDLWVTYYGNGDNPFVADAEFTNARAGAKFPNLLHAFRTWPELLRQYDALLVLDDDIRLNARQISRLFAVREQHDFWVMQPAFDYYGKISHKITGWQPQYELRYTNFIEVNTPLFRRDILESFLEQYDPKVIGYGIDWWYSWLLARDVAASTQRIAVIDTIRCLNPHDFTKQHGKREIDQLQSLEMRRHNWQQTRIERGIDIEEKTQLLGGIRLPWYRVMVNKLLWRRNKQQGKKLRRFLRSRSVEQH